MTTLRPRSLRHTLNTPLLFALAGAASLALVASGCGNEIDLGSITKEQAAQNGGKNDRGEDLCELLSWYGDGVCDDFCPRRDRDCEPVQCEAYPACDEGDEEVKSQSECRQDARCYQRSICGYTIWCTGGGKNTCPGENPQGCSSNDDCAAGEECVVTSECRPSACGCDPETGGWICTADCGGGTCQPHATCEAYPTCDKGDTEVDSQDDCVADGRCYQRSICGYTIWCTGPSTGTCPGENPAGCVEDKDCGAGQRCERPSPDTDVCRPSACGCDEKTNAWVCTADCGGGVCVPDDQCQSDADCGPGSYCSACLTPNGTVNACLPEGAAC